MSDIQFFDFAAQAGLTKHFGEQEATDELIQYCHITKDTHILDVGCGVGQTPVYIAKTVGARVTGVDINAKMVRRSQERAQNQGVTSLTEFRVAEAQDLPFPDETFDAVITESVTAFPDDKQLAVNEYARARARIDNWFNHRGCYGVQWVIYTEKIMVNVLYLANCIEYEDSINLFV